jgi:hypothetical protein
MLISTLCARLNDADLTVAARAGLCLSALISQSRDPDAVFAAYSEQLLRFILAGLDAESPATLSAVSLVGVLTKLSETAPLIAESQIQERIVGVLTSRNPRLVVLALQQILAMSAIFPDCRGLSHTIPRLFEFLESRQYGRFPILCITNLTVIPENAVIAAQFLNTILTLVNNESDVIEDAIVILYRVVIAPESNKWMDQVEVAEQFVVTIKDHWKADCNGLLVSLLYHFAALPIPCRIMKDNGILELVTQTLSVTKLDGIHRPRLLRIKSLLSED